MDMRMTFLEESVARPRPLCDARGQLNPDAIGFSLQPAVDCAINGRWGRRKRWNHWCITTPEWMLAITLADMDYVGLGALYFLDLHTGHATTLSHTRLLAAGCSLPDLPHQSHGFTHPKLRIHAEEYAGRLRLCACVPTVNDTPMHVALDIQRPPHLESMNLTTALGRKTFHSSSRQLCLPVTGDVFVGRHHYACLEGVSFAALDFGRGVWPIHSYWQRAAFCAPGGIAANLSTKGLDHGGLSENVMWLGGKLLPIDGQLRFEPSSATELAPWHIRSENDELQLTFEPRQLHHARPQLGPFYADTRQWFGRYAGTLRDPDGVRVPVHEAYGWLGETHTRW